MINPNQFSSVPSDMEKNPLVNDVYHEKYGFMQVIVPEDGDESKAIVSFLEQPGWEPFEQTALGISKEGLIESLSNEFMLGQFASLALQSQLRDLEERSQEQA